MFIIPPPEILCINVGGAILRKYKQIYVEQIICIGIGGGKEPLRFYKKYLDRFLTINDIEKF